ncbi:MAG: ATP-binding cassette domain-containing protein [Planctomycetaceae bacterium]
MQANRTSETAASAVTRGDDDVIRLLNVGCRFGSQHVLKDLTLGISAGETLAIIGESGCGKSVTMKVMMQLIRQTSGSVEWFGRDVTAIPPGERLQQQLRLGYLFQGAALFDSLNIFENVAFGIQENQRFSRDEIRDVVFERLREVGLQEDVARKRPSEISGGMQKRVGLARALALSPDVMFYDEPTTGLDPVTSRRIDDLIESVRRNRGVAGIIVTHDLRTVRRVADRVVMLYPLRRLQPDDRQLIFDGTVTELAECDDPRVREFVAEELSDVRAA